MHYVVHRGIKMKMYTHRNESMDYVTIFDKGNRYEIGPGEEKELPCKKPGWGVVIVNTQTPKEVIIDKPKQMESDKVESKVITEKKPTVKIKTVKTIKKDTTEGTDNLCEIK